VIILENTTKKCFTALPERVEDPWAFCDRFAVAKRKKNPVAKSGVNRDFLTAQEQAPSRRRHLVPLIAIKNFSLADLRTEIGCPAIGLFANSLNSISISQATQSLNSSGREPLILPL